MTLISVGMLTRYSCGDESLRKSIPSFMHHPENSNREGQLKKTFFKLCLIN
jgi:hypothetical protein